MEISKLLMYELWYDYMKPKYGDNVKLCYMDTDSFIMSIKTEDFYKDIATGVEQRLIIKDFLLKTYLYLTDDCKEGKKSKGAIKMRDKKND